MAVPAPGCDVSNHQGAIRWGEVAASGIEFAVIKASEGVNFRDPYFSVNWSGAKLAGIVRGAYHFCRADQGSNPITEADWFLSIVGSSLDAGDFLALDIEDAPGGAQPADLYRWVSAFVGYLTGRAGFRPLLYSTAGYLAAHNLTGKPDLSECGLWLADWRTRGGFPAPPPLWPFTAIWQHSDNGSVPGIAGPVDLNRFNGSVDRLRLYGKPAATRPDRAALDALFAALQGARGAYTANADVSDLNAISGYVDEIKRRYGFQP